MGDIYCFSTRNNGLANCLINNIGILNPINRLENKPEGKVEHKYRALWDTGSTSTVISDKIVKELNLKQVTVANSTGVHGSKQVNVYLIDLYLPNRVRFLGLNVTEAKAENLIDCDVLIGMDVIRKGDFAISNFKGKTTFSFRYPSVTETDYVQLVTNSKPAISHKIERNAPCPCGSGKKYKNCHGRT
jgi:hypothetical protein